MLQNLDFIADRDPELVLILAGDHVYKMDYRPFIEMHRAKGADVTCAVRTVPIEEAHRFGILDVDADGRVTAFIEKPAKPPSNLVSMGVYVFAGRCCATSRAASGSTSGATCCRPWSEDGRRVFAYEFAGYWQDVGTVESYWQTNLDLLVDDAGVELNDLGWLIYTSSEERPPARIGPHGVGVALDDQPRLRDRRHGRAQRPLARRPGRAGAMVRDSIVMFDAVIEADASSIAPSSTRSASSAPARTVGVGDDLRPNRDEPERLYAGITLVGKRARIPAESRSGATAGSTPERPSATSSGAGDIRSGETVVAGVA